MKTSRLLILALASALAPAAAHAQAQAPAAAAAAEEVQMEHVSIRAIGTGEPVVLIPGLASPRNVYAPLAAELARTHRVLLVQVNGFGGDAPRGNAQPGILAGVTSDVARYLAERNLSASVIGHSVGGVVGMRLARDHPRQVRRLMIVDALPFIGTLAGPAATVESVRPMAEAMRQQILAAGSAPRQASPDDPNARTMSISPEGRRQVSAWGVASSPQVVSQLMYEDMQEDLRPDLGRIAQVPTTVLYAVPPQIAEQARALWTGAYGSTSAIRLIPVEESFHFIMLDQPERFVREVKAFLAG